MKKEYVIIASAAAAVSAGAAAAVILLRKKAPKKPKEKAAKKPAAKAEPKNVSSGSYSFVSGLKNAREVEAKISYNADRFMFKVIEDEFLTYTGDSHVAALYGDDYSVQIEYADYYSGDSFEKLASLLADKYTGFETLQYGPNTVYKYYDGSSVCFCVGATEFSYLLVTAIPGKDSKVDYTELASEADLSFILASITI